MMPFDDDEKDLDFKPKVSVKSQGKSIFDNTVKKPSAQDFEKKAIEKNDKLNGYEDLAKDLAYKFKKILEDKTLISNKSIFSNDIEKEIISKMVNLAVDINTDEDQMDGMGSIGWIALLLKSLLLQRDRINQLEYSCFNLENKLKEIQDKLDTK